MSCTATKTAVVVDAAQSSTYKAQWKTNAETGVVNYEVQQATDTTDSARIKVLVTVTPKRLAHNIYVYTIPLETAYYRVAANMVAGKYRTNFKIMIADGKVMISDMKIRTGILTDILSWHTFNEAQVAYYLIEKSAGGAFTGVYRIPPKGDSDYSQQVYKGKKNLIYRNTPFYKDGSKGQAVSF